MVCVSLLPFVGIGNRSRERVRERRESNESNERERCVREANPTNLISDSDLTNLRCGDLMYAY